MSDAFRRVVVIGSGIGGLLAARVLSRHADHVTVVDRDQFPETAGHRSGVPQSHHLHGLQMRGAEIIYSLFPEVREELAADGAAAVHEFSGVKLVTREGLLPLEGHSDEGVLLFSRYLLEWRLREILRAQGRVEFRPGTEVTGLVPRPAGAAGPRGVAGVRIRRRGATATSTAADGAGRDPAGDAPMLDAGVIDADLVVDASGRQSRLPDWLDELGHGSVHEETLTSDLSYASRFYERPADFPDEFRLVMIPSRPPDLPRGGLVQDIEDGLWHVSLVGTDGHKVPTDEEGFLRWASELPDPSVYEAIRVARPVSPIRGWRTPTSRWRHLERMPDWPSGLIALGDAVCALNPTFGQGMTVAAMEAEVLAESLAAPVEPGTIVERSFQQRLAATVAGPWLVASTEDLSWPSVELQGARPPRGLPLMRRYLATVLKAAVHDHELAARYFAVVAMQATPSSLFAPSVLVPSVRQALGRAISPRSTVPVARPLALSPVGLAQVRAMPPYEGSPVDGPTHQDADVELSPSPASHTSVSQPPVSQPPVSQPAVPWPAGATSAS